MLKQEFEKARSLLPELSTPEIGKYGQFFDLLKEWNEKINLVSRKSFGDTFAYHLCDSIWIAEHCHGALGGRTYRDLGTGAGFPGVVFAIRYPEEKVLLYEKLAKRRAFLEEVIRALGLRNTVLEGALPSAKYRDFFTARAVFPVSELLPFFKKNLARGGRLAISLGGESQVPIAQGFGILKDHHYALPENAGSRKLLILERST